METWLWGSQNEAERHGHGLCVARAVVAVGTDEGGAGCDEENDWIRGTGEEDVRLTDLGGVSAVHQDREE